MVSVRNKILVFLIIPIFSLVFVKFAFAGWSNDADPPATTLTTSCTSTSCTISFTCTDIGGGKCLTTYADISNPPQTSRTSPFTLSFPDSSTRTLYYRSVDNSGNYEVVKSTPLNFLVNASCSPTHYGCITGTSTSNLSNINNWTWSCAGLNGGTSASCSELKPVNGGWGSFQGCTAVCGGGTNTRTCNNLTPSNGGTECTRLDGTLTNSANRNESISCNTQSCGVPWIQTSGGDIHSNTSINTQPAP